MAAPLAALAGFAGTSASAILRIGVSVVGLSQLKNLKTQASQMTSVFNNLGKAIDNVKNIGMGLSKLKLHTLFKPSGTDTSSLFVVARAINTIAANIRFFQLTLAMFIGGNVVKGFINAFIKLNSEIQSASLSLEAIIQAQKEMALKKQYGIFGLAPLPTDLSKLAVAQARKDAEELTRYATRLGLRTGGDLQDMIQAARGIQVNTTNVALTKRMLDSAVQLALLDPVQGMGGATFAIRELLQGQGARDFKSLAMRFELSFSMEFKKRFTKAVQSGKIKEAIDMFQAELASKGITDKILKNLEKSWILSLSVIKGYSRLILADIGESFFTRVNEYFAGISQYLMLKGKGFELLPEYRMVKFEVGDILDKYIAMPLINGMSKSFDFIKRIFNDKRFYSFSRSLLNQGIDIFNSLVGIFKEGFTIFFRSVGVIKNNNLLEGFLNFISLLVTNLSIYIEKFISMGGLQELGKFIRQWGKYYQVLLSERHMEALIRWTVIGLKFKQVFMEISIVMVPFLDAMSKLFLLLVDATRMTYKMVFFLGSVAQGHLFETLKRGLDIRSLGIEARKKGTKHEYIAPPLGPYALLTAGQLGYEIGKGYSPDLFYETEKQREKYLGTKETKLFEYSKPEQIKTMNKIYELLTEMKETGDTSSVIMDEIRKLQAKGNISRDEYNKIMSRILEETEIKPSLGEMI